VPDVTALQRAWTGKFVRVKPGVRADLLRFEGRLGRVVTVTHSGRALVDFADGAWYDLSDFASVLDEVADPAETDKFDTAATGAQKLPTRQS
jgi:hypothetical protein